MVVFYNLQYNAEAIGQLASAGGPMMESKVANTYSGFMVHPQNFGDDLVGAFTRSCDALENVFDLSPLAIIEIFKDDALSSASCYPARVNAVMRSLEDLTEKANAADAEANGGAVGIFDTHTDASSFVLKYVDDKLKEKFPELYKTDKLDGSHVRELFADPAIATETGLNAASPRINDIILNLQAAMMIND